MNILNLEHICKSYGEKMIFDDISQGISQGDKIGIVGINGTGKSTLLKIIAGMEEADSGQITKQRGIRIGYLAQEDEKVYEESILSYVIKGADKEDWNSESEAKNILNKLGVFEYEQKMNQLSGGQKKRVELAQSLMGEFDILIMDEPTNHLDEETILWLENYLMQFKGTLIVVTHDRYFLDKVTNKIWEINHGSLYAYSSNYTGFLEQKALREEMELATERKRKSILRGELEWASRGCRARTTKQRARLERLEELKERKTPVVDQKVQMDTIDTRIGKKTIAFNNISKTLGGKKLIDQFTYIVLKEQRLGIVGPNGCGKSTLLKMIVGMIEPDEGNIEIGETIKLGYFGQDEVHMNPQQRVIDYVKEVAEYIPTKEGKISASQLCERFLFDGAMQYSNIGRLSGGEKRRLHLLRVLAEGANVYLFDEPGNNLDIPTITILEDFLNSFSGILITVSHDRYFLDNVADRILAFEEDGIVRQYEGGYTDYLNARNTRETRTNTTKSISTDNKKSWKENQVKKLKFTYMEQKEFETIEDDIASIEEDIEKLEAAMLENSQSYSQLMELNKEKEEKELLLEEKMDRWEYLNDLAEKIAMQDEK